MEFVILLVPFLLAIFLGKIIIPYIMLITYKKRLFDPVDARKLHQSIIPRLGGVAFVPIQCCLLAITMVIVYKTNFVNLGIVTWEIFPMFIMLVCGMVILYIIGIADDLIGVSYKWKFVAQILVASLFPLSGLWINDLYGLLFITYLPAWVGIPFTIFVVVLIINAINLIDGLDGLCSGLVGVGCLVLGSLFAYYQAWIHALLAFITTGILISFFYYNVFGASKRRRRIFMGDTGSMTLGYTMAFLAISFAMNNFAIKPFSEGAIVVAFSILIVPVFDVARVIFIRWYKGLPLFKADRSHLHHKLLRSGMSHKNAMMSILALSLFFCIFNIVTVQYISNNIVVLLDLILWGSFTLIFNYIVNKKKGQLELNDKKEDNVNVSVIN
ncbi:MraY family glycosyltransferase [Sphingobacterium lactis]|uniref:UDP-N-acetylmuramyl pentapeptide phosphotransferase/UDP-N-acetylglucosamine-1-phosphate transferase n=1 Tax=Sphingobacterium lactis TaxID=797291 RepID=A0A1H6CLC1_9SPHI|nr:MraY family glycosyltransferase [Sphingobacterium lactis]SEG73557.1 UDP-N-acetylmuramyl pentapeptide phosphotransferase/UDP-N-acetylglucosamine-1-phosphate transferase [Sphingobacterium lactis]